MPPDPGDDSRFPNLASQPPKGDHWENEKGLPPQPQEASPIAPLPVANPIPSTQPLPPPLLNPTEPRVIHPTSSQQPTPPQDTKLPPAPPKPSHLLRNLFVLIVFLSASTIATGLTLAYNNYPFIKPPQLVKNSLDMIIATAPVPKPARIILNSALAKGAKLTSANQKTEISVSTNSKNAPISAFKLTVSGPVDFAAQKKQAAEAEIGLEVKFEGAAFSGSASFKQIDKTLYFKVNEVPFGQFYQQLLDHKGKWFYYNIPSDYLPKKEDADMNAKLAKVISGFAQKTQVWTKITSQEGDTYTMEISPPKSEIDKLIFDLIDAYQPKNQQKIISDQEREQISKATEKINNLKITANINKSDYNLKKAQISFDISIDNLGLPPLGQETLMPKEQLVYNLSISTQLSNYNKKVVIIPPTDAINIEDVLQEIQKKYSVPSPQSDQTQPPQNQSSSPITQNDLNNDQDLRDLMSPPSDVLGTKIGWEAQTLDLFSSFFH